MSMVDALEDGGGFRLEAESQATAMVERAYAFGKLDMAATTPAFSVRRLVGRR